MQQGFHLTLTGQVQGVGYRAWFARLAQAKGISGYVKNLSTGQVEAVIVGDFFVLQALLDQSLIGPPRAQVTHLDYYSCKTFDYRDFKIQA
ncbi:acylphosphatase [Acinetobacter sp.]|uniref:acylphosphatase n=1 Tax=Acinetobacter sp. TaxID=472 RepID=UPI00388EC5AA